VTAEREGKKNVMHKEGLVSRREKLTADTPKHWLYEEDDAIITGENRKYTRKLYGMFGASATTYGAIGENYMFAREFGAKET
ncbi:FMN-binding glutamate synthase family protein, partial [Bacillus anthracis]|nr:FMN-binding glutamate synthase family protein [Bacillus anthracis]